MMLRSTRRYHDDDPPPSRWFRTAVALVGAALFAAVWVAACVILLGALALWFF